MGVGTFGSDGELFFEIQLVPTNGEAFFVSALFDTGFTNGWLVLDSQDLEALCWTEVLGQVEMRTARGEGDFYIYEGKIIIDDIEVIIVPVYMVKYSQTTTPGFKQHHFYHEHDRAKVLFALDVLPDIPYPS